MPFDIELDKQGFTSLSLTSALPSVSNTSSSQSITRHSLIPAAAQTIFLSVWLFLGAYLFWQYRHLFMIFECLYLPIWVLAIICWLAVKVWKRWFTLVAPILTLSIFGIMWIALGRLNFWEASQTVDDFIDSVERGAVPSCYEYDLYGRSNLESLAFDFSTEYDIQAFDYWFGAYEYVGSFPSGEIYDLTLVHRGGDRWDVSVSRRPASK